mmetsp:Transcript_3287/g.7128  ORF Transcript_3287/g.7128 Transcript_3287/m.7128 type:complete len:82 (+) Transcript_3287:814-1059(+)
MKDNATKSIHVAPNTCMLVNPDKPDDPMYIRYNVGIDGDVFGTEPAMYVRPNVADDSMYQRYHVGVDIFQVIDNLLHKSKH